LLSPEAKQRLEQQLRSYEQGTTRQIAVAIFPSLEDESVDDFSMHVAEKWKIGGKKNNDGVLITLFVKERRDRIEVGYGLEDRLTDALTARIRTELMEPRFKQGDFEGGLREGLAAIDTATGGHAHNEGQLPARQPTRDRDDGSGFVFFLIIVVVLVVVSAIINRGRGGRGGGGFWSGGGGGSFIGGGSGWSSGGGGWSGGGGGGGWSGGGGSFGGGGSSGSW
jgi:uncharacterized protein